MYNREYASERITELKPNEIFVFGSNLAGGMAVGLLDLPIIALAQYGGRE